MNVEPVPPPLLGCPTCSAPVLLHETEIVCERRHSLGRFHRGVWDFVAGADYAASFGQQWQEYRYTQVDSKNGTTISRDQFARVTGWTRADLDEQRVLDAGCGAGRYSEIVCALGGRVTSVDLSDAAFVARELLSNDRATVVRGNLLEPPFREGAFDKVFSIGVLQHTPDPLGVAKQLVRLVKPGGEIAIWMYHRKWFSPYLPKYLIRRVTNHLPGNTRSRVARMLVTAFTPVARLTPLLPAGVARRVFHRALPMASYWGLLPLTPERQREWSFLDTNDWLTPEYDLPKSFVELKGALEAAGAVDVRQIDLAGLTVRARRRG